MRFALLAWTAAAVLSATARTGTGRGPRSPARLRRGAQRAADRVAAAVLQRLSARSGADDAAALCTAIVAELRAGAPAGAALVAAGQHCRLVPRGRAAALLGEPVGPALAADAAAARAAGSPDAPAVACIAACWRAAAESGAGLAEGLERVATLAQVRRRVGDDLAAEIAAPRATARMLALLPLLGLLLGEVLGAQPLRWLSGSPIGWACLALGVAFMLAGRLWSARIVASALPRGAGSRR